MSEGFFPESVYTAIQEPVSTAAKCGLCQLFKSCKSPKMEMSGSGKKGILIVGEAPGRQEDERGLQFVGDSGQFLLKALRSVGVEMRRDCWMTNSLACRPQNNDLKNKEWIDFCRPKVLEVMNRHDPSVIILLGSSAIRSVIGHLWKEDVGGSKKWAGVQIPSQKPNCWICPTFHPSFIMRENRDAELYFRTFQRHLASAVSRAGTRPWSQLPDYAKRISLDFSDTRAAGMLLEFSRAGGTIAFDYETNCLKPDSEKARIVAASVCWEGKKTIAFPWTGEVIPAMRELLRSKVKKIAHNCKFEERWTRAKLGTRVLNWDFDSMITAHVLDCRPGIAGLKFQAYARLGMPDYDSRLKPYLSSKEKGGNELNRVDEIDLPSLLLYCGYDSYLTYKIAKQQREEL